MYPPRPYFEHFETENQNFYLYETIDGKLFCLFFVQRGIFFVRAHGTWRLSVRPRSIALPDETGDTKAGQFWSTRYGRSVSDSELQEITQNLGGFFRLLRRWKEEEEGIPIGSCSGHNKVSS